jgi:glycosyltransferase involved in cell wall biosynthesis
MKHSKHTGPTKKLAIVFDDLIQQGGAEKLLCTASELFPNAPVYTSLATKKWLDYFSEKNTRVVTSFMQKIPFGVRLNRVMGLFGVHSLAFSNFVFDDYEVVLSISSRFAHHIITKPGTVHICYINSPGRMFWEPINYFEGETFFLNRFFKRFSYFLSWSFLSLARIRDYVCAQRVDYFIANSKTPQARVTKYYGRTSQIIYPFHSIESPGSEEVISSADYFLIISRLQAWKKIDIAIKACEKTNLKLKIIGEGADFGRLRSLAGKNTELLGRVSELEKQQYLENCKALIMTQKEDFGIIALEAMAVGKPVIAYGLGGALETVLDGVTGVFFYSQDEESLRSVLVDFDGAKYKTSDCINQASRFTKTLFDQELKSLINMKLLNI